MLKMADKGGGGVWTHPFLADIICEQPLRQNLPQNKLFLRSNFTPFISKSFQISDPFFLFLFPKDSKSLKTLDIQLWEVGKKRRLNGTSNV